MQAMFLGGGNKRKKAKEIKQEIHQDSCPPNLNWGFTDMGRPVDIPQPLGVHGGVREGPAMHYRNVYCNLQCPVPSLLLYSVAPPPPPLLLLFLSSGKTAQRNPGVEGAHGAGMGT